MQLILSELEPELFFNKLNKIIFFRLVCLKRPISSQANQSLLRPEAKTDWTGFTRILDPDTKRIRAQCKKCYQEIMDLSKLKFHRYEFDFSTNLMKFLN